MILLDIMMPGIDGFELCKRIRALVDCPILFLTARTEENSLENGLSFGADDYISKPFGVIELRARINAHLRREHREPSCLLYTSFASLPQSVQDELHIMCVMFTVEIGGIFTMWFDSDGSLQFETEMCIRDSGGSAPCGRRQADCKGQRKRRRK